MRQPPAPTASRLFALAGLALAVAGAVGAIVIRFATQAPFLPVSFGFGPTAMVAFIVMGLSWASTGAFLVIRRPENTVGRVMVVAGAGYALSMLCAALTFAFAAEGTTQGHRLAELAGWATVMWTQFGAILFLIGFIFPTGRAQSPRWAWLVRLSWPGMVLFSAALLLQPGPLHLFPTLQNPFGFGPDLRGNQATNPLIALFSVILAPGFTISLITRYRTASRTERQQLKWFVLALAVAVFSVGFSAMQEFLATGTPDELGLTVYGFAAAGVPVAIGIAILRYHLFDIDRIISRTIAYAIVSAITAIVFGGAIVLLSAALASFIEAETIAVAGSTLAAFAVFQPLLRRVRRDVDRRFNRARYDAEQTVAGFAARLRDEVDIGTVTTDLHGTVQGAVNPSSLGLWIREARP
jgi:hypothetical protein